ncbi:BatD family protein [Shewanella surugensis]|uniref:BatD family protein n=1 Tax=Shewanella surugensis TaxID=212020 RepID=A0ABT0LI31_9GAMM|nr:BatD family protein [Shewanella surugensis]MCL1127367.1 BatD family protein [Shewanella surugensis]
MVKRSLLLIILLGLIAAFPARAITSLQASVDKNIVNAGESLMLTITADDSLDTQALDTSALKNDFTIQRPRTSHSTRMVNFTTTKETQWQVLLLPKRQGHIIIPAFSINGVSSAPIKMTVKPRGSMPKQAQNVYIEAHLSTQHAYVEQLINYKVKLFLAAELQRGILNEPIVSDAEVKQLGEDKDTTEIINGRRYRVIERNYAIIADKPGKLTIQGASFNGDITVQSQRSNSLFGFTDSRPVQTQAANVELTIKDKPASYHGHWFVADLVLLNEDWPKDAQYQVGTPITRTVTLTAVNTDESRLPDLNFDTPSTLKSYPEKAQRENRIRDNKTLAILSQTTAIIPTKAGTYTLPALDVPWWNPHLKKQEIATLPARSITVKAAEQADIPVTQPPQVSVSVSATPSYWMWIALTFATLWIITLIAYGLLWRKQSQSQPKTTSQLPMPKAHAQSNVSLKQACKMHDPSQVLLSLQQHFSDHYQKSMTLDKIAQLSPDLASSIAALQRGAFSQTSSHIDYDRILHAVRQLNGKQNQKKKSSLSDLNP